MSIYIHLEDSMMYWKIADFNPLLDVEDEKGGLVHPSITEWLTSNADLIEEVSPSLSSAYEWQINDKNEIALFLLRWT